jgi:hypothetical protein
MAIAILNVELLIAQLVNLGDNIDKPAPVRPVQLPENIFDDDHVSQLPAREKKLLKAAVEYLCECHEESDVDVDNELPDSPDTPDQELPDAPAPKTKK